MYLCRCATTINSSSNDDKRCIKKNLLANFVLFFIARSLSVYNIKVAKERKTKSFYECEYERHIASQKYMYIFIKIITEQEEHHQ